MLYRMYKRKSKEKIKIKIKQTKIKTRRKGGLYRRNNSFATSSMDYS